MLPELLQKFGLDILSHPSLLGLFIFLTAFTSYEVVRYLARFKGFSGPLGLPILGNLWQIRGVDAPELYRLWSKKYGAAYQIQLGNIPVLVINKAAAAKAIFVQNSHATRSRPEFYTFHKEIISSTSSTTLGTAPYNDSLKRRRKAAASALNRPAVETYIPHLDEETKIFLTEAYNYGQGGRCAVDPMPLFLRLNLSLSLTLHWGDRMTSQSDLFREIVHVEDKISGFRSTTGNLQDYIPLLRLNPFSMASEAARQMRNRRDKYMHNLDQNLNRKMKTGEHNSCIRANIKLDSEARLNDTELASLNVTMLAAGLDTMNSAVSFGIAMLATMPEIQAKAFAAVRERYSEDDLLCDAKDQQTCEYVVAMVKEILRYYTPVRLSLPRRTLSDIVYEGKMIPKGSILFLNAWACNMDEDIWHDPEVFRPERWLEQRDAPTFTFGVGSRMCAGTQLAYRELYLLFMRLLSSFKVEAVGYVNSDPVSGTADPSALVAIPTRYNVRFVPRNEAALQKALQVSGDWGAKA